LDAMYRVYEETRAQAEGRIRRKLRRYGRQSGIPEEELEEFVSDGIDFMRNVKYVQIDQ